MSKEVIKNVQRDLNYKILSQDELHSIEEEFVHNGWILTSWNTLSDGSGEQINLEETINPTSNKHFYAQWKRTSPNEVVFKSKTDGLSACYFSDQIPKKSISYASSSKTVNKPYKVYYNGCISNFNSVTEVDDYSDTISGIGNYGFYMCTNLTSVNIPSIKSIGSYAFQGDSQLSLFNFPKVETIGSKAFYNCNLIEEIKSDSLQTIGSQAFYYSDRLKRLITPNLLSVDENVFYYCQSLEYAILSSLKQAKNSSFSHCIKLSSAYFPNLTSSPSFYDLYSVSTVYAPVLSTIPESFFSSASNLISVDIKSANKFGNYLFRDDLKLSSIYVNNSQYHSAENGYNADGGSNWIVVDNSNASLVLAARAITRLSSDTINKLVGQPFFSCKKLSSLVLPNLTSIGAQNPFYYCYSLSTIYVNNSILHSTGNGYPEDGDNLAVVDSSGKKLMAVPQALTRLSNDEITSINSYVFYSCSSLYEVHLSSVVTLGTGAFDNTYGSKLSVIDMPVLTSIPYRGFMMQDNLISVSFDSAKSIGTEAFYLCDRIKYMNIPKVTSFGSSSFLYVQNAKIILSEISTVPSVNSSIFYCSKNLSIYLSNDYMVNEFSNNSAWSALSASNGFRFFSIEDI